MAMTADGKIDTVERRGARISGAADSTRVDALRAGADAIMVGSHTLLGEDPRLTVRDPELLAQRVRAGKPAQPSKVGVVSRLDRPGTSRLTEDGDFLTAGGARVILCTSRRSPAEAVAALEALGVEVIVAGDELVELSSALSALRARGIERLMVEGGGTLVASLLEADLVDELQLAIAPLLFGGATAPTPVAGAGRTRAAAIELQLLESGRSSDGDVILRYGLPAGSRR